MVNDIDIAIYANDSTIHKEYENIEVNKEYENIE